VGKGARRGRYLFPCCTGPSVSLNHSLLQHVQRDFGVGSWGSFPRFSATNITSRVRYSRPAVGVTLQWSCRHVRLVTAHIFTSLQLNQQLNIHANITHVRKQIRLTSQTKRNSHYREVNCRRTTPKSDYYALFTPSVRIQKYLARPSVPTSTRSKHTEQTTKHFPTGDKHEDEFNFLAVLVLQNLKCT